MAESTINIGVDIARPHRVHEVHIARDGVAYGLSVCLSLCLIVGQRL